MPSRESTLFSTSWGILQQLKPLLFILIVPVEQSKVQVHGQIGFSTCVYSVCKALIHPAPFGCQTPVSARAGLESVSRLTLRGKVHAGGCYFDFPNSFCFHRTWRCLFQQNATPGNTYKPLCKCKSSEAEAVFEARWDQFSWSHTNAELEKPSESCLGSLAIEVELWTFVSGWTTYYGKERDLRFLSIIRQLSQTVSSATGSLFLQTLGKVSLTLRHTIAETLFIGGKNFTAHGQSWRPSDGV